MSVSSYLEAFLTMYGWEFYYILYLMLALTGLFVYPLLRTLAGIYVDYLTDPDRKGNNHLREAIAAASILMIVFFIALVPMVPADLNQIKIKSVCTKENAPTVAAMNSSAYFRDGKTRIPVMPWLAIMLGQGTSSVIYKAAPCSLDITEAQKAVWNSDLDGNEELKHEYRRFRQECHEPIVRQVAYWRSGVSKKTVNNRTAEDGIRIELKRAYHTKYNWWEAITRSKTQHDIDVLTNGLDSQLFKNLFYNPNSDFYKEFRAAEPVPGYNGDDGNGVMGPKNPPTCGDWWLGQGATQGLRVRLASGLSEAAIWQIVSGESGRLGVNACIGNYNNDAKNPKWLPTEATLKNCKAEVVKQIYNGDENKLVEQILDFDQGKFAKDTVLTNQDRGNLKSATTIAVGAALLSKFADVDLSGGFFNTIVSFYTSLYMLKLLLKHLLPMILMTVYMFWGIYMVLGRMSMDAIIKGMILIFSLTIIPGLWAVMEHLDDTLWQAMYGGEGTAGVFDMALLDAASNAFYVACIFVLFYVINLAEAVNVSSAVRDSQSGAQGLSSRLGGATGTTSAKLGGAAMNLAGGLLGKAGRGFKSGFSKLTGK